MSDSTQPDYYMIPDIAQHGDIGDVIGGMSFWKAAACKYIWRAGKKDPHTEIQDLQKAIESIRREIERIDHDSNDGFSWD